MLEKIHRMSVRGSEKASLRNLLPRLLSGKSKSLLPIAETLNSMSVKKPSLGLQDPVASSNKKYLFLIRVISEPIGSEKGDRAFSTSDHLLPLREESRNGQQIWDNANDAKI